jgi:hypothetical protein
VRQDKRDCPLHSQPMTYQGSGIDWPHNWACAGSPGCWWAAATVTGILIAGACGVRPGDGYLTYEQWCAQWRASQAVAGGAR